MMQQVAQLFLLELSQLKTYNGNTIILFSLQYQSVTKPPFLALPEHIRSVVVTIFTSSRRLKCGRSWVQALFRSNQRLLNWYQDNVSDFKIFYKTTLLTLLYVRVIILLASGKHLHHSTKERRLQLIILFIVVLYQSRKVSGHVHVCQDSEWSCICVLGQ